MRVAEDRAEEGLTEDRTEGLSPFLPSTYFAWIVAVAATMSHFVVERRLTSQVSPAKTVLSASHCLLLTARVTLTVPT